MITGRGIGLIAAVAMALGSWMGTADAARLFMPTGNLTSQPVGNY
jgi:hypothetical protein